MTAPPCGIDAREGDDPAGDRGVGVERQVGAVEEHVGQLAPEPQAGRR